MSDADRLRAQKVTSTDPAWLEREAKRAALLALAERCEREEPSRELDSRIAEIMGWTRVRSDVNYMEPTEESFWCGLDPCGHSFELPRYTTSLDAAVTLVGELRPWVIEAGHHLGRIAATVYDECGDTKVSSFAKTPALALCAAALRARAEEVK